MTMTATEELVVRTKAGELRGAYENGIAVFRGVPYAAAPVGELRFAPPQPAPAWQGVRDATQDGPIPPQGRSRLAHVMGDFERPQSEDCLTLNIWTPAADSKKRPVLVWIHGGAFASGAGSLPWYSGERFAANGDVVVVSINYRLGALGFLCLPGVSDGNLGLLDQVAALRFVRDNIAAFGGDPDNVTVVGQSAGAASIAILMTMPQAARSVPARDPAKHAVRTHVAHAGGCAPHRAALAGGAGPEAGRSGKAQVVAVRTVRDGAGRGRPAGEEIRRRAGAVLAGDRRQGRSRRGRHRRSRPAPAPRSTP